MKNIGHLALWLIVNVIFGFLQLIYDFATKLLNNVTFDSTPLVIGGSLLFFCSAFIISVAFDSWVTRRHSNVILFTTLHIVVPILVLLAIVTIYSSASNLPRTLSPDDQKASLSRLFSANIIILITSLAYGIYSKFEQLQQTTQE